MSEDERKIDELIQSLASEAKPVKTLLHPALRVLPWVIVSLAYMAGVIHFLGLRYDFSDKMREDTFMFEMILVLSMSASAAYAAGLLSIPDMRAQKWFLAVPTTIFGVFMLWMGAKLAMDIGHIKLSKISWHHCFSDGLMVAFIPVVAIIFLVRRGCTTMPGWACFMSTIAVGGIGWIGLRLSCSNDHIAHTFYFHYTPFLVLGVLLGLLAHRIYKW